MNTTDLTCPFCNARVGDSAADRVTCPRCGETFAGKSGIQTPPAFPPTTVTADPPPAAVPPPRAPGSNRLVLLVVVGGMAVMAVTGLTYALLTREVRREHDKELPRRARHDNPQPVVKKKLPPAEPVAPARLEGLGYLPPRTGLVVGAHVHELLTGPAADDVRTRGLAVGGVELRMDRIKDLTGVDAEDVEHVVIGTEVVEGFPPLVVVVRMREKYDADRLLESLGAEKPAEKKAGAGKRTIYELKKEGTPLDGGHLLLADERTFVLGLLSARLETVPEKPAEGTDLPAELREVIAQRLSVGMPAWVAGHSDDWKTILPALLGASKGTPMLGKLDQVRTFAIGYVPGKPTKAIGAFRCRDEAAAKKLEAEELLPRKKQDESFGYAREKEWLSAQWKVDAGK
jgi:hypothetical protein